MADAGLNIPFEPTEPIELDLTDAVMSGGVVVRAAKADGIPVLIFGFARADGSGFLPPIVFGLVDGLTELLGLIDLIGQAGATAIATAAGVAE